MSALTHIDSRGEASMVDVSAKPVVLREAVAAGEIRLQPATLDLIESNQVAKGNVLATARLAGIMAAKRTGDLIPLCHPLPITHCEVNFEIPASRDRIVITASAKIAAQTGIEMEALTAVSLAALTIYDMCKAVDKQMVLGDIRLVSKTKKGWTGIPTMNANQPIELRRGNLDLGIVAAAEAAELLREGFFQPTDLFRSGQEDNWQLLRSLEIASAANTSGLGAKVSAVFSQAAASVRSHTATATNALGDLAGRGKQQLDQASQKLLEDFVPRIQALVGEALVKSSTTVAAALADEVFLRKLFGAIYDVLPAPVHRFVSEETFVAFGFKHRNRLLASQPNPPASPAPSAPMQLLVGILTISDRASKGLYDDLGGPALKKVAEGYGWKVCAEALVPDEKRAIQRAIREQIHQGCNLVLTTGGTGVALRDVTPEAVREIAIRELPGFGEVMRMESMKITKNAILSRNLAVVVERALVVCLPGKPSGAVECLGFVVGAIPHCVEVIQEVPTSC